ncbi:MAG: response regulator [Bacteroidales bacterium]|nr:response regulator [Bacteroidales bacterium]
MKIKLLENQNDQKAGRMEEKLLLWLVSETIEQSGDGDELIINLLERISQIRDIPLSLCYQVSNYQFKRLIGYYSKKRESIPHLSFQLDVSIFEKLKSGPVQIKKATSNNVNIEINDDLSFQPGSISVFPFQSLYIPSGIIVFINDAELGDQISDLSIVVRQLIYTAFEKYDKLKLMEELKELNMSFENKLRERTQKLQDGDESLKIEIKNLKEKEKTLVKKLEIAEKSSDLNASFLMNIGHEIRTPLNGILGFAELIRNNHIQDIEREKYINIIKTCGKSLLKIVDDVIDLSKIESGQVETVKESFLATKFLTELFDYFKTDELYKQKELLDLRLNINVSGNTLIETDPNKLRQIMINVIGNALKFTEKGFVEIGCKLEFSGSKKGRPEIIFFVKDTGVGIPVSMHDQVFNRFTKIEHDISKLYGGTGLGLTIARDLIEMLDGKIWFTSEPGRGAEFYISLPASAILVTGNEKQLTARELKTKYNWEGKTALIVEDDEMSFIYLKEVLRSTNIQIIHAGNGLEAVEMAEKNPEIDIVLMDIKLPEMDGYEATKRIKDIRKNMPVIAQTAYAMLDDQEKILQVGCDEYISKPINRRKLLTTMDAYLS